MRAINGFENTVSYANANVSIVYRNVKPLAALSIVDASEHC